MFDSRVETEFDELGKSESDIPSPTGKRRAGNSLFWDLFLNFILIFGLVIVIRSFVISPFHVYGASMCDTINFIDGECRNGYGEYNIVNKLGYLQIGSLQLGKPDRGDIIVFHPPEMIKSAGTHREFFIKRIIGLPGDTVVIRNGLVYLRDANGDDEQLKEPYLNEENLGNTLVKGSRDEFVYEVPENMYFVLGDNRVRSTDSRACFGAVSGSQCTSDATESFLDRDEIAGRAWLTLWPPEKIRFVK